MPAAAVIRRIRALSGFIGFKAVSYTHLSSGVAGLTTYKLLQSNEAAKETSFNEMFKQKTAYEIASGDWSSDVCSSDLPILKLKSTMDCLLQTGS